MQQEGTEKLAGNGGGSFLDFAGVDQSLAFSFDAPFEPHFF